MHCLPSVWCNCSVQVDEDGFVVRDAYGEMSSCNEFTRDGKDNGKARIISLKTLDLETRVN